jgi:ribosomal protein L37AE/L43A
MSHQEIRYITRQLIRNGFIVEEYICEECGAEGRMNGHHYNYDNPFNIIWLCDKCHLSKHKDTMFPKIVDNSVDN